MTQKSQAFKPVDPKVDFVGKENQILDWWYSSGLVEKYLHKNDASKKKFSFLDGPITANNPMGVQHGQGRALKDLFQRYKNAQGFRQRFQNGFDCQGLWLEVQEERDLGLNSKRDIEAYGMEKFCLGCRRRVDKFSKIQTEQSKRLGMFMDWDNSYYTMSETNNLYIWYFLKKCHEKGWLYKGVDSMPWCTRCGTAISKHELSDDGYKVVEHTSIYVKFRLSKEKDTAFLIWTTTPWTLAVNVAVAVNPDNKYVLIEFEETKEKIILAENRLSVIDGEFKVVKELKGSQLEGLEYIGPFDELPAVKGTKHFVIPWRDVSDEEGSGLVHIAPGAGEEDFHLGREHKLKVLAPLDEFGVYLDGYGQFTDKFALDVKEEVFQSLRNKGLFYKTEQIIHSYPHCWRCKQELVFRATSEWFIRADEIRPLMKQAAKKANWLPASAEKRMQDWLNNMGDWPISRRRYWGLALPFYECTNNNCNELTVIGSKEELRKLAVNAAMVDSLKELHRPWIDEIVIKCPKCKAQAKRVKEVGDCWLDAGIVPFSTVKYLENKNYWKEWFPFEFITEYIGQIKLWFYSTLFMAVTLENKVPWTNVLATGYIVDEKGEPMHKTKGNYIPFDEAAEKMGVDVMRWVYFSSNPYENIKFGYEMGNLVRRRLFLTLWNVYSFFLTYANLSGWKVKKSNSKNVLDQWVFARLNETVISVTRSLDKFDPYTPTTEIEKFVSDLSTWYIRRSRGRMTDEFFSTCYEVLVTLCKLLAPFTPFIAEEMYKNLTDEESVHLANWPAVRKFDQKLLDDMQTVRKICEMGHAQRKELGIRLRQPLAKVSIDVDLPDELLQIIKDELNVKEIIKGNKVELDTKLTPELEAEGKARDLVREIQDARKKAGTALDEKIIVHLTDWPKNFEDYIKKETLAEKLVKSDNFSIEKI